MRDTILHKNAEMMRAVSYIFLKAEAHNREVPDVVGTKC